MLPYIDILSTASVLLFLHYALVKQLETKWITGITEATVLTKWNSQKLLVRHNFLSCDTVNTSCTPLLIRKRKGIYRFQGDHKTSQEVKLISLLWDDWHPKWSLEKRMLKTSNELAKWHPGKLMIKTLNPNDYANKT